MKKNKKKRTVVTWSAASKRAMRAAAKEAAERIERQLAMDKIAHDRAAAEKAAMREYSSEPGPDCRCSGPMEGIEERVGALLARLEEKAGGGAKADELFAGAPNPQRAAAVYRSYCDQNSVVVRKAREVAELRLRHSDDSARRLEAALDEAIGQSRVAADELVGLDAVLASRSLL